MKAAIVILNFNGEAHLSRFLPSVIENCPDWARIIVADNGSTDNSLALLQNEFPKIEVIVLEQNFGFAGGYNRALDQIDASYYVILNSDVAVQSGWLETIIDKMDNEPDIAAAQPKIKDLNKKDHFEYAGAAGGFMDTNGYPFCRGRIFDNCERDIGQHDDMREVFWASGACLIIRSEVYHDAEGFDEDLFAHMEEIDLCWRLKNTGHRIYCIPQSQVYHLGGGTLAAQNPRKTYLNFRNNLLIILKNDYRSGITSLFIKRMILDGLAAIYMGFSRGPGHFLAVLKAHFHFYKSLGAYRKKRRYWREKAVKMNKTGMYRGSIIRDFYLDKKRVFGSLETRRFIRQDRKR